MIKFRFKTTETTQDHCESIVRCLMKYGGKTQEHAINLVHSFYKDKVDFHDDDFDLHEHPYDDAMAILYGVLGENRKEPWWFDPQLSPRPKDWDK